ncbi:hypothetical protein [Gottfriedia luciferensis]|uniref:hypothetical protein n=1 Tax=Gottfriedia luciferensis TaxID=178774 RepID=UPI000B45220E|nr:hypothetical protein [Gottfriedia luciferensis]
MKTMEKLLKAYEKVVNETLEISGSVGEKGVPEEFWTLYSEKGISDDDWIKLLKGYERVTNSSYRI